MRPVRRRSKGQALVEFGLVLPILLVIFVGIFEIGRLIAVWIAMQQGAQEAARWGSIIRTSETQSSLESGVLNTARNYTPFIGAGLVNCSGSAITSSACTTSAAAGAVALQCQSDPTSSGSMAQCTTSNHVSQGFVRVEVTYPYQPVPIVYPFGTIQLRSWAQVRVE